MTQKEPSDIALPSVSSVLDRIALPFALFVGVLAVLLIGSWVFALPRLTTVEVSGVKRDALGLKTYVRSLEAQITQIEDVRDELVTPLRGGIYGELRHEKVDGLPFTTLRANIEELATSFRAEGKQVVSIERMRWFADGGLQLIGRVHSVGPRSMTVLGQFVDALKDVPGVTSVNPPTFTRNRDESGPYSPFDIRLRF